MTDFIQNLFYILKNLVSGSGINSSVAPDSTNCLDPDSDPDLVNRDPKH
jgi:hypothetical protein